MNSAFHPLDYIVFAAYAFLILGVAWWVSRTKKGETKSAQSYFLAGKSLPWWAIGASLIAANISAEQFIGMSGSGYAIGLAIASYEWMAAITLLIVGKYFLPIFLARGIYTIPGFIAQRYSEQLKTILAVFWMALYIFVNITSVLYLGALALHTVMGISLGWAIVGLAVFAGAYSFTGGLASIAWTDGIQVFFLILGGLLTTYLALDVVSGGNGWIAGFESLLERAPDQFHMILSESHAEYMNLPGIGVLIGGLWVANLYYWGFNQYIIQRALAAKSLGEAQKGIAFAAGLKILLPFIVVIPGIAAYVITNDPALMANLGAEGLQNVPSATQPDKAYPWLIQLLPTGVKGLAFVALTAAVVSSLASMLNSTATIFTMDIYQAYAKKSANDETLVRVGRITAGVALLMGAALAPLLGGIPQAFQFIQEYTGLVSPGILAVFILGLFWEKANNKAAIIGVLSSIPIAFYFKIGSKGWITEASWSVLFPEIPFLSQMGYTFLLTMLVIAISSYAFPEKASTETPVAVESKTPFTFTLSAWMILLVVSCLYAVFW